MRIAILLGRTMPDRRQHVRRNNLAPAIVGIGEDDKGVVVDMSEAGIGVVSAKRLDVGLMPAVQFELEGSGAVHATGYVAWSDASGRAGVALSNVLPIIQQGIGEWLAANAAEETEAAAPYPGTPVDSISDWVTGPLPLSARVLQHAVRENAVGVYMLGHGNGKFHVVRAGRAEDLRAGLVAYIGQYDQFLYAYSTSDHDAFRRLCRLYHHYRPPRNRSHPARRPGTNWDCPVCFGFK
jgi:hypothetical protein